MRFLHISDLHIGKYLGEMSLLQDQKYFLEKICELCEEQNIDAVVIAGDIYQRSMPSAEAMVVFDWFLNILVNEKKVPVMLIAGNHDSPERIGFGSNFYNPKKLAVAGVFNPVIQRATFKDEFGEIEFFLLPYLEPAVVKNELDDVTINSFDAAYKAVMSMPENKPDPDKRNIIVAHGYFAKSGTQDESVFSESERSIGGTDIVDVSVFDAFDYGAFGHLHAPQKVGDDTRRYSGSMLKYSKSECTQKKSICIVDIKSKENIKIEQITIPPLRDVRTVKGKLEDIIQSNKLYGENLDDYIFAELLDDQLFDGMSQIRTVFPNTIGLMFKQYLQNEKFVPSEMLKVSKMSTLDLFKDFYSSILGETITQSQTDIVKKIIIDIESGDLEK